MEEEAHPAAVAVDRAGGRCYPRPASERDPPEVSLSTIGIPCPAAPRSTRRRLLLGTLLLAGTLCSCFGSRQQAQTLKDAELHYQLGDGAFRDHQIPEALRELMLALKLNPQHAQAEHLLGFIYMGRQEYDRAAEHFRRAVTLEPDFRVARNNLGTSLLALCRWSEAAEVFRELDADPLYATPFIAKNNLGLALLHQGQREEAVAQFQRAVFLNPSFCVGFNNLGMTLLELERFEDAARALQQALAVDPSCTRSYAEPHFHLGRLHEKLGDRQRAHAEYSRCVELTEGQLDLSLGCGQVPVGRRCSEKVRQLQQLEQSAPWPEAPGCAGGR